jgi:small nuclear ribonucleoprotein (snRNP)-like protein
MKVHSVLVNTPSTGGGFPPEGLDSADGVERFVADVRVDMEVAARRRERLIRDRLVQDSTIQGALMASIGQEVAVQAVTGDRITGELAQVGLDVVQVCRRHLTVWVAIGAIAAFEVPKPVPAAGPGGSGVTLFEVMTELVDDRAEVLLTLVGGTAVRGELVAVGDVATLRTGPGGRTAYASVAAVAFVSVVP